jgi:hypothetical protein
MIETIINIGKTLRETGKTEYKPFIVTHDRKDRMSAGKKVSTKTFVYDVKIDKEEFEIFPSEDQVIDERVPAVFIKGDSNDRYYIAGDINSNYFGKKFELIKYFESNKVGTITPFITQFRNALRPLLPDIVELVKKNQSIEQNVIVQFRFLNGGEYSYWIDRSQDLGQATNYMVENFYLEANPESKSYMLAQKTPFTAITAYNLNSLQNLDSINIQKVFPIDGQQDQRIKDLIVGANHIHKGAMRIGKVLIQLLPAGNYKAQSLLDFLEQKVLARNSNSLEQSGKTKKFNLMELLETTMNQAARIDKFDIIFLKQGGNTTDVINYISQISRGEVLKVISRLEKAEEDTKKFSVAYGQALKFIDPFDSLTNILKDATKDNKKLEKHQINVLYKIFRDQYYSDTLLLKGLIQQVEMSIRNSERNEYPKLFLHYYYLNQILHINEYQMMVETQSYQIGQYLGILSRDVSAAINSFSKQYVGNISRRVSTISDFHKFLNYICEKLAIHEQLETANKVTFVKLSQLLSEFNEPYKKDYVVAGFFSKFLFANS